MYCKWLVNEINFIDVSKNKRCQDMVRWWGGYPPWGAWGGYPPRVTHFNLLISRQYRSVD